MQKLYNNSSEPKRKLSFKRVCLAIIMLAAISYGSVWGFNKIQDARAIDSFKPWFGAYVDVTATPRFAFEQQPANAKNNLVLSFIVSSKTDSCIPTWGGEYSLDDAETQLDLDRRIERVRQTGGSVAVSFGGLLNDELAVKCTDQDKLFKAYKSVIDRYSLNTIDLDLEQSGLTDMEAMKRRAEVVAKLQKNAKDQNKKLAVWLTLPVAPQGLTEDGTNAVATMLTYGVDLAGVNAMTMDYGNSRDANQSMSEASKNALIETHRQLGVLWKQAGINISNASVWSKIGATPMIGQNDTLDEIFTLEDARALNEFAASTGIARMSMWSANRDIECGENYVNIQTVSDSCSGIKQDKNAFANILSKGFVGSITGNTSPVATQNPETTDDPMESPYQIWTEIGTYLAATKVVWHHNVYQAKWWTQGDLPDNPVLQSWETPWQLVGPVLPGEKPVPQPTLPAGTYPEWSGTVIYDVGDRILFSGVPYQAKWWTQGDSPAASTSNPNSSPWVIVADHLTQY